MTKTDLFIELSKPNKNGVSRWVDVSEFTGKYKELKLGNGGSWCRKESTLAKKYIVEFDKTVSSGNGIDKIRLNGFNNETSSQMISSKIKNAIKKERCVILGTSNPEVDHKNGRKNESRVMNNLDQQLSDFQPLSKAANDAKRQFCKECKRTGNRYDAKEVMGYPISFYKGGKKHDGTENGCEGCFWYDPIEFRKHLKSL